MSLKHSLRKKCPTLNYHTGTKKVRDCNFDFTEEFTGNFTGNFTFEYSSVILEETVLSKSSSPAITSNNNAASSMLFVNGPI